MTSNEDIKDLARRLKDHLQKQGIPASIFFNEERRAIRVEFAPGSSPPPAFIVYGRIAHIGHSLIATIPASKIVDVINYRPAVTYQKRQITLGGETFTGDYALVDVVGITADGTFLLESLGKDTPGVAGVVPFFYNPTKQR